MSRTRIFFEKLFSGLCLALSAPLMVLVALAIRLESPGPVIFRQTRIGLNHQSFGMYKFRTMHSGAEKLHRTLMEKQLMRGHSYLLFQPKDNRTTRVGRILRKLSIDEFPQFLNVLRGDMSIVGPRPMLPAEIGFLSDAELVRFSVLPGMTGLAQIRGRGSQGAEQYIAEDLEYIAQFTPKLYWTIIARTPVAVLSCKGAT